MPPVLTDPAEQALIRLLAAFRQRSWPRPISTTPPASPATASMWPRLTTASIMPAASWARRGAVQQGRIALSRYARRHPQHPDHVQSQRAGNDVKACVERNDEYKKQPLYTCLYAASVALLVLLQCCQLEWSGFVFFADRMNTSLIFGRPFLYYVAIGWSRGTATTPC